MSVRRVRQSAPVTGIAVGHANPDFDAYAAMVAATNAPAESFCLACFDGEYPIDIPDSVRHGKMALESLG